MSGTMPRSDNAPMMPMCDQPRDDPLPSARPIFGLVSMKTVFRKLDNDIAVDPCRVASIRVKVTALTYRPDDLQEATTIRCSLSMRWQNSCRRDALARLLPACLPVKMINRKLQSLFRQLCRSCMDAGIPGRHAMRTGGTQVTTAVDHAMSIPYSWQIRHTVDRITPATRRATAVSECGI